jgi:protein TonB
LAQNTGLRAWGDLRFGRLSLPLSYDWEAGIVAAGLHAATVVLMLLLIGLHMPEPPPDQAVISVIPEAPPQGDVQPQAVPPAPQPLTTPMASAAPTPDALLPLPPPVAPPRPVPPHPPRQQQAHTQGSRVVASHRGTQAVAVTRPAQPNSGNVAPNYSPEARMAGEQGEVHFVVDISPWGTVRHVTITGSSGYADLDNNVRVAAQQWHFKPALHNGKPVASTLKLWVRFETQ